MALEGLDIKTSPEQLATDWSSRVGTRLRQLGIPEQEVIENVHIIQTFTRIGAEELLKDPRVALPYDGKLFVMTPEHVHQIIELFLRGVNQVAKRLRDSGMPWEKRKGIIEEISWKIFNLAKLLVAVQNMPAPAFRHILQSRNDLKFLMKHSAAEMVRKLLAGEPDEPFKFDPDMLNRRL